MNRAISDLHSALQVMSSDIFICNRSNYYGSQLPTLFLCQKMLLPWRVERSTHAYTTAQTTALHYYLRLLIRGRWKGRGWLHLNLQQKKTPELMIQSCHILITPHR